MALSTTYKQTPTPLEIEVPGLGLLDADALDVTNKQFFGSTYILKTGAKQKILESLGFSANFNHSSVGTAYLNIANTEADVVLEVVKNAKPNDVAVRYSAERWQTERASTTSDGLRPWLKNTYRCRPLPEPSIAIIGDALSIATADIDKYFIRIDLKKEKLALVVESGDKALLPASGISTFSLPPESEKAIAPPLLEERVEPKRPPDRNEEITTRPEPTKSLNRQEEKMNSTQPRYATYSQSEVDQLLRQQSEQLNASIQSKVASQRKEIAESLKANEKQLKQIADEMKMQGEEIRKKLEQSFTTKSSQFGETSTKARAELTQQIETFKTHINKNVMPSLKNLDTRIRSVIDESKPAEAKPTESKLPLTLASLALAISLVNLALNFLKH